MPKATTIPSNPASAMTPRTLPYLISFGGSGVVGVDERIFERSGYKDEIGGALEGRARCIRLDEADDVLLGVEATRCHDGGQPNSPTGDRFDSMADVLGHLAIGRGFGVAVECGQIHSRGNDGKSGVVLHIDGALVAGVGILLVSFQSGRHDVDARMVHGETLSGDAGAELVLTIERGEVLCPGQELVELLGAERVGGEREGHTGQVAQEHGGDPAVAVVPGERIGQVVSVVGLDVGDPIAHQERPQFLLGQERVRIPGREPDDPDVWGVGVGSFGVDEFRPAPGRQSAG